ncbi:RHS repeat protein [Streptomyces tricolor]|nr:RHS repeat protein [Streptomyces tricolor]
MRYAYNAAGDLVSRTNALGQVVSLRTQRTGADRPQERRRGGDDVHLRLHRRDRPRRQRPRGTHPPPVTGTDAWSPSGSTTGKWPTAYDAFGNLTARTTPSGAVSTWEYDAAGRPLPAPRPTVASSRWSTTGPAAKSAVGSASP